VHFRPVTPELRDYDVV